MTALQLLIALEELIEEGVIDQTEELSADDWAQIMLRITKNFAR